MTLTINLTPTEEANLSAAARQAGFTPETWIKSFLRGMQAPGPREESLVAEYHALLDREDGGGLSDAQSARLRQVEAELDTLEDQDTVEQSAARRLRETGDKLDEILTLLRSLPRKEAPR